MTDRLQATLKELAGYAPPISVPAGIFRRARRRRALGTGASLVVVALLVLLVPLAGPDLYRVDAGPGGPDGLPARLVNAPQWTAAIDRAPLAALVAVYSRLDASAEANPLTLVGRGDQYRVYDRAEWTPATTWGSTFLLSPDGRYLLMPAGDGGRLLDVTTGRVTRKLAGRPLAWSPDGKQAVLLTAAYTVMVVTMPVGRVLWQVALPHAAGDAGNVLAALAPDNSAVAVTIDRVTLLARPAGIVWSRSLDPLRLAGSGAWRPDGTGIALLEPSGGVVLADPATGDLGDERQIPAVAPQPADRPPHSSIVGWLNGQAVAVQDNRVLLLSVPVRVLVTAPARTFELQVSTDALRQGIRPAGPVQAGPFTARYHTPLLLACTALVALALLAGAVLWRRRS